MSKGGRYANNNGHQHGRKKSGMGGGMIALITIAVVLIVVLAVLIGVMVYKSTMAKAPQVQAPETTEQLVTLPSATTEETAPTSEETTEETTTETTLPNEVLGKKVINILLVGQQERAGEKSENGRMADTQILATLNMETKTLTLTSFMRDTYVKLPDYVDPNGRKYTCGKNRINMAYHLGYLWGDVGGAMQMANECIYNNFGVEIDYDIEVNFDGFIDILNLLDGVEIEITEDEAEYLNNDDRFVYYDVQPGLQYLDGMAALSYARMRKAKGDHDSDIKRTERQRKLITAVIDKLKQMELGDLQYVVEQSLGIITTNMTNEDILNCMWTVLPILPQLKIETGTCPVEGQYWGEMIDIGGVESSVLQFSKDFNTKYMTALTTGQELPENPKAKK